MSHPVLEVGDLLIVGPSDNSSILGVIPNIYPGTAAINGPCYIGLVPNPIVPTATCMIGPPLPAQSLFGVSLPALTVPISLEVTGTTNHIGMTNLIGDTNQFGLFSCTGIAIKSAADITNGVKLNNGIDLNIGLNSKLGGTVAAEPAHDINVSGPIKFASASIIVLTAPSINLFGVTYINGVNFAAHVAAKPFDIPHPSNPNTHRLRYVCLEGPEVGAYIRGKLENSNIIELPIYWKDLVYPESITVNLTPFGYHQELYVEQIEWGTKIKIKNNSGAAINCYYTVFGERRMKDKLQPEYEGTSPNDYPGDNSEYSIAGWNYDRRG